MKSIDGWALFMSLLIAAMVVVDYVPVPHYWDLHWYILANLIATLSLTVILFAIYLPIERWDSRRRELHNFHKRIAERPRLDIRV